VAEPPSVFDEQLDGGLGAEPAGCMPA
jgi:hypothetical protein